MRRIAVLAVAGLALVGVVAPESYAQAPTPTFKITGLIDNLTTYAHNVSNLDGDLNRIDKRWYARTRGRFDFIGELGKAKGVLGLEIDMAYGQTGSNDSTIVNAGAAATTAVTASFGTNGGFDLNTDSRGIIEVKWLYTEFELPFMPVPTAVRLGAQPFGAASTYKLATYSASDFPGVNIVSTLTPNVKLVFTYVQVEEALEGRQGGLGVPVGQLRGDDFAIILAPEITPMRGLDIKPMYSYFYASGTTSGNSRQGRGGLNTSTAFTNADGTWRPGINENRHMVGVDARFRSGPLSFAPTVLYQFGSRDVVVPASLAAPSGKAAGSVARADLDAWLLDLRAGYQIGPLLLEALYVFTTGNKATDTTLDRVRYFQPLATDFSYLIDWGSQLSSLGLDYNYAMLETGPNIAYPGLSIGWDKYGRHQIGAKATYALTPALSMNAGANLHLTHRAVDTDGTPVAGAGILPAFATGKAAGDSNYVGTELFGGITWRFAPGLAWENAVGYMLAGKALDAVTSPAGPRDSEDSYILTSRVRFSF